MEIRFAFNLDKALQAMALIVQRLGPTEKVKLMKLLYIADKTHFLNYGFPITGDRQCAMPWGPVPSDCLHAVNGELWPRSQAAFSILHVDDNLVSLKVDPGVKALTQAELNSLETVIRDHGLKNRWTLVGETHRYPEYAEVYVQGSSRTISYESILRHAGRTDLGRPVIGPEILEHMINPFGHSETDL